MTATKSTRTARTTRKPATPAPAPAKRSHRLLVGDAAAAWQQENQQALTIIGHLSGTATAGSVWKVRTEAGEDKRAVFEPTTSGGLRLTGFDEKNGKKSTRDGVAEAVAKLGEYVVVMHSSGSVWTVKDAAGALYLFDTNANTLAEKPAKKAPAKEAPKEAAPAK